ncbi:PAS domain-containing protein [Aureimonas sp. D3]|uniref:PAS domain-containing protein n=1 Tax=Aureimonas sp. D3 TaxID=1638164 RepID=UPI0007836DC1|nr:PAS domain-containing protein [Aureimonas sp. D3]
MARRVRAHDWAQTPLGAIETWPQSLRTALDMVLAMPRPTTLLWGPEHVQIYNDAYVTIVRTRHPALLGRPAREGWSDVYDTALAPLLKITQAGQATRLTDFPVRLEESDGQVEERLFDTDWSPVPDESGRIVGALQTLIETTDRFHVQTALRESEARHRLLIGSWAQAVWETDAAGVVVADSPSWRAYTGQSLDEWLGYGWLDAIHPHDRAYAERQWRAAMDARGLVDAEFRLRSPDGGWRWTNVRAAPVLDAKGRIAKWAGMNINIDARKRADAVLRAGEERHRTDLEQRIQEATAELKAGRDLLQGTLDASTDMIQVFEAMRDEAGEIIDFRWVLNNHTSESRYGEVRGESLLTRNPGVVVEGIFDAFKRVTQTGRPEQAERHYVHEQFDGWFYQSVVKLGDGVATTTKEISDWKTAQAELLRLKEEAAATRLQASEERFRSFAENSTDPLWIVDARTRRLVYLSPAFERIWGERREIVLDDLSRWVASIHPEDRKRALAALPGALAGDHIQIVYRIRRFDDGRIRWIQDRGFPIRSPAGEITHVGGISQDVTEHREMAEQLRQNQRRLWTVIEGIPQLVWRSLDSGQWTWASPQWCDVTGQTLAQSQGYGWLDALHPEDRSRALAGWERADGSSHLDMETRLFHAGEGRYRWFQTRALPVRDEAGQIVEWLGTSTAIDDMRQLRERQQVLMAELQHRARNLIGVVRAIADRTADGSNGLPDFLARFRSRLAALARINSLLSRLDSGERVTFDILLRTELEARGFAEDGLSDHILLAGPEGVCLRSASVQTFALAIHELTTNAVKYGALSGGAGRLNVTWRVHRSQAAPDRLHVEWSETGVADMPEDGAEAQGSGYGRTLIEKALPYQLGAITTYELRPDGVRCTIDLPLHAGNGRDIR